jgi:hypothetical protein
VGVTCTLGVWLVWILAVARAAELSLPADVQDGAWREELARVEAALPMPPGASIAVARSARGWRVTMSLGPGGCAPPPFEIPSGPGEIRSVLWVAAAQLRAAECAQASSLPLPPARSAPAVTAPAGPAPAGAVEPVPEPAPPEPEILPQPAIPEVAAPPPPVVPAPAPVVVEDAREPERPWFEPPGRSLRVGGGAVVGTGIALGAEAFLAATDRRKALELRVSAVRLRSDATYRAFGLEGTHGKTPVNSEIPGLDAPGVFGRPWARPAADLTLSATWGAPIAVGPLARVELRPERPGSAWRPWPGVGATGRIVLVHRRVQLGLRVDGVLEPLREERRLVSAGVQYDVLSPWLFVAGAVDVGWLALHDQGSSAPHQR